MAYPDKPLRHSRQDESDLRRQTERLQILSGERGKPQSAAVRRSDLPILTLASAQIAAAPTQADYNKLQADVATLAAMLAKAAALEV